MARGPPATPDPVPGLSLAAKSEPVGDALALAAEGAEVPMMRLKPRGGFSKPLQRRTQIVDVLRRRPHEPIYERETIYDIHGRDPAKLVERIRFPRGR